jgi:hypothetical protein
MFRPLIVEVFGGCFGDCSGAVLGSTALPRLSLAQLVLRDDEQALKCSDLHFEWNRLANEYEATWENMYARDADERLQKLTDRSLELSKAGASIPDQDKRPLSCQECVEMQHTNK